MNKRWSRVLAASVVWLAAAQAQAQQATGEGCDGVDEKGVMVPCAGYDFCICAMPCESDSACTSSCCRDGLCVPACVCEGQGAYSLCDTGELPSGERESEPGGCAFVPRGNPGFGGPALLGAAVLAWLGTVPRRRQKGGERARA